MWVQYCICIISLRPLPPSALLMPPPLPQFQDIFFIIMITYTHTPHWVHLVVLVGTCVQGWLLGIRSSIRELLPRENWFSLISSHWLPVALHLEVEPCEISSIHIGMSASGIIMQVLFGKPHCGEFMGAASLSHLEDTSSKCPGPLALTIFLLHFLRCPLNHRCRVAL